MLNRISNLLNDIQIECICFCLCIFWLLGAWPGYAQFDSFHYIRIARWDGLQHWLSLSMSYLTNFADLFPNPIAIVSLTFILIFSALMGSYWKMMRKMKPSKWDVFFVAILILNPLILSMTIYYNREVPFALINGFLMLKLMKWKYSEPFQRKSLGFILWVLLLGLFCEIRQDAIVYLAIYPLIGLFLVFDKKSAAIAFVGALIVNLLLRIPVYYKTDGTHNKYFMTGSFSTLIAMGESKNFSPSSDQLNRLSKVISDLDFQKFRIEQNKYPYLLERTRVATFDERMEYYSVLLDYLTSYPGEFLANRWDHFCVILGVTSSHVEWFADEYQFGMAMGFEKTTISEAFTSFQRWFHKEFLLNNFLKRILCSCFFALGLSLLALIAIRKLPASGSLGIVFLIKFLIVFFVSPIDSSTYLYVCYLGAFLMLPLMIKEYQLSRNL